MPIHNQANDKSMKAKQTTKKAAKKEPAKNTRTATVEVKRIDLIAEVLAAVHRRPISEMARQLGMPICKDKWDTLEGVVAAVQSSKLKLTLSLK